MVNADAVEAADNTVQWEDAPPPQRGRMEAAASVQINTPRTNKQTEGRTNSDGSAAAADRPSQGVVLDNRDARLLAQTTSRCLPQLVKSVSQSVIIVLI